MVLVINLRFLRETFLKNTEQKGISNFSQENFSQKYLRKSMDQDKMSALGESGNFWRTCLGILVHNNGAIKRRTRFAKLEGGAFPNSYISYTYLLIKGNFLYFCSHLKKGIRQFFSESVGPIEGRFSVTTQSLRPPFFVPCHTRRVFLLVTVKRPSFWKMFTAQGHKLCIAFLSCRVLLKERWVLIRLSRGRPGAKRKFLLIYWNCCRLCLRACRLHFSWTADLYLSGVCPSKTDKLC